MPHLFPLGAEIGEARIHHIRQAGNAFHHLHAGLLHGFHFFGVVRHQADRFQAEELEDLARKLVVAQVAVEAELLVGFDGVGALVL